MNNSRVWKSSSIITAQMIVACVAALLLLWGLGNPYLWQDEAATAVLARRMLRFGRPLAYDGVNLITIDHFAAEEKATIDQRTRDPQAAINYYVRRGDLKADTTWKWQPWGQFVVAALSFKTLGATTLAARLPFALAGIATVLILYRFVLTYFKHAQMALLASGFLVLNAYWILHGRQCRYYSLSSLFMVLTLVSYARWQWGGRWGGALFVITAWCWFQVDYGTVWPVLGVLFADAVVAHRRSLWRPTLVGGALGAAIAPFAYYYELWGRHSVRLGTWHDSFMRNLLNVNEYVVPVLIVGAAIAVSVYRWKTLPVAERRLVVIACAILVVLLFWVPAVAPFPLLRYVIIMAPVGCLLVAWVLVRLGGSLPRGLTWAAAAIFLLTPWLSLPLSLPLHVMHRAKYRRPTVFRRELEVLRKSVFGHRPDPNRLVADWLKQNAAADDEILINYEDIPLMFYLPNPIRGGVAAFRVEDDAKRPPDFVVLRHSVEFGHWPVYLREVQRYGWTPVPLQAPDVHWGNCPDPIAQEEDPAHAQSIYIVRRAVWQGTPAP
ncbi:MAG: ArnT family glycosyltransferase [Terriglobales bacterium]